MKKQSLQKRIFKQSLLLVLIPLTLFIVFNVCSVIRTVEENFRSSLTFQMKQLGSMLNQMLEDANRASLFIVGNREIQNYLMEQPENTQAYETTESMRGVYNMLIYLKNTSSAIQSIQIAGTNNRVLSCGFFPQSITEDDWTMAVELRGQPFWSLDENLNAMLMDDKPYICQSRLLRNTSGAISQVGIVKVYLDNAVLDDLLTSQNNEVVSYYLINSSESVHFKIVGSKEESDALPDVCYTQLLNENGKAFQRKTEQGKRYFSPYYLDENGWILYGVCSPEAIQNQICDSVLQMLALVISCFSFCFLIAESISKNLCKPLENIANHMKRLGEQDFSTRVEVTGSDEICVLASQFNRMSEKIQSLVEEVYLASIRRKELELQALQSQVNPHFLYNTLDMIYWTAKLENAPETSDLISSLSQFFRQALSGGEEFTTLENEIEHLRYYVILCQQSKRPFSFELDVNQKLASCRVIKLILQPLVENAVLHGIGKQPDGKIHVEIFVEAETLVYMISDNGPGLNVTEIDQLLRCPEKNHRGFGIKSIQDRIQLVYGSNYGLQFKNIPGGGTQVVVRQPYREETHDAQIDGSR